MNYYDKIKEKLLKNEIYAKVKDYSKERNKVLTYFEVGKLLSEAGKKYGNDVIGSYAEKLAIEVGKKYNVRTLRRIRQFYNVFKDEKWSPSATVLNWSHYTELLALNDINKINYYIDICKKQSLSRNDLRNKIKSKEYERLSEETKNKLVTNEELKLPDLVPDPLLIKSEFNIEQLTEYAL